MPILYKLLALFFVSITEISYEIFIMRVFSVGGWSNFGSLVISTALLGIGLSGIILTFISDWVRKNADRILPVLAIAQAPAMSLAVLLAQMVPFNPVFMGSDPRQLWFICAYYIIYGVPFFIGAAFIGVMFIAMHDQVRRLYSWNLLGAGLGGLVIIVFMFILPPDLLILPIIAFSLLTALLAGFEADPLGRGVSMPTGRLVATGLAALLSVGVVLFSGGIRVSEYKPVSYVRKYPDTKLVHHSYGPGGEYEVYASSYLHFAPGLSDNASLKIAKMPRQPFWGLFIDGAGPIGIMGDMRSDEAEYMDFLPMAAPYAVLARPKVLLVNLGGGINAQIARYKGAGSVDIVEPSDELISLIRDDPNVSRFTGNLLKSPLITVHRGDPRAYCSANPGSYDLVEISLVDSIGLADSGGYPVKEDYTYTVEAIKEYLKALRGKGILSITVWDRLNPPRNVPRLMNAVVQALREDGISQPENRVFSFNLFMSTATILVKNSDFTEGEIYDLQTFAKQRSFSMITYPGMPAQGPGIDSILQAYSAHFGSGQDVQLKDFNNTDFYRAAFREFAAGRGTALEKAYVFDIRPGRDSRPYYSGYLKFWDLGSYLSRLPELSEEWGYLLILGVLIQALLFGALVVFLPVVIKWKSLFKNRKGTAGVIGYYASLGLTYMLVELFLIQRFDGFLSNPTYSMSIVITVMLIFSAFGNLVSGKIPLRRDVLVWISCGFVVLGLGFYIFGLDAALAPFRSSSLILRLLMTAAMIAPVAFVMGVPYPNGLDTLQRNRPHLLPWAWGMNGGLSIAGSALARLVSVTAGFPVLLGSSIFLYALIGALYKVNEASPEGEPGAASAIQP